MATHGRFSAERIARERLDFPEPELPAIPIMVTLFHGGE